MKKNKVLVAGGRGHMGRAIADALSDKNTQVICADIDTSQGMSLSDYAKMKHTTDDIHICCDLSSEADVALLLTYAKPDIVISAATYYVNKTIASECIHRYIPYCDLGGHRQTSNKIEYDAQMGGSTVFTDLGLAPGLVNIVAHSMVEQMDQVDNLLLQCGGLPEEIDPLDMLNYICTWSMEGLYNEYVNECKIIKDGKICLVKPIDGVRELDLLGEKLESFNTSGVLRQQELEQLKTQGLQNVEYRTIRMPGHAAAVTKLLEQGYDKFKQYMTEFSYKDGKDVVIICVQATGRTSSLFHDTMKFGMLVKADENYSAMQIATAQPCAAVVKWMLEHKVKEWYRPMSYSDVPLSQLVPILESINPIWRNICI